MGNNESAFKRSYEETVAELSSVQLAEISSRFNELYARAGGPKRHLVDREAFSKSLNLPVAVGDRLFDAFDEKKHVIAFEGDHVLEMRRASMLDDMSEGRDKIRAKCTNGKISFEEFVCGLAVVLHGSFSDKCRLLFRVFNLRGDEGVSRAELTTMLSAILHSTHTILHAVDAHSEEEGRDPDTAVQSMVDAAFENCDISRSGKLLPLEFEYWLKRNPKILDCLLPFHTRPEVCTLKPLLENPDTEPAGLHVTHSYQPYPHFAAVTPPPSPAGYSPAPVGDRLLGELRPQPPGELEGETGSIREIPLGESTEPLELLTNPTSPLLIRMVASEPELSPFREEGEREGGEVEKRKDREERVSEQTGGLESTDLTDKSPLTARPTEVGKEEEEAVRATEVMEQEEEDGTAILLQREGHEETDFTVESLDDGQDVDDDPHAMQRGTMMQSHEVLPISPLPPLSIPPPLSASNLSHIPSSPVLPTTTETVTTPPIEDLGSLCEEEGEEGEGMAEEVSEGLIFEVRDLTEDEAVAEPKEEVWDADFAESEQLELTEVSLDTELVEAEPGEDVRGVAVETEPVTLLPDSPERRPSPYLEGDSVVREDLYTAWLPSSLTQKMLAQQTRLTSAQATCPGLSADIKAHDPIYALLSVHHPTAPRLPQLTVDHVSMDGNGLKRLVAAGCYHAALELTGRFLSAHGQGLGQAGQPTMHTHKTLGMWAGRLSLLVQLRRFREAEVEMAAFKDLDGPDLFYQFHRHSYPGKTGSMIPFSLRLLHAQLPSYLRNNQESLDRLCKLKHTCSQILSEISLGRLPWHHEPLSAEDREVGERLWRERCNRLDFAIGNCLIALQDYGTAVSVYQSILPHLPELSIELNSAIGRLHLQLGDLSSARESFSQASSTVLEGDPAKAVHCKINDGLANVYLGRWQTAMECFDEALHLEPANFVAQNNLAVCAFYQGRLKEAISRMEVLLRSRPPTSLQPGVFANLSAAYNLESGNSEAKKLGFLPLLALHVGESFFLQSLAIREQK